MSVPACLRAAFLSCLLVLASRGAKAEPVLRSPVGSNLDGLAAWSPQIPFVNVMKSSTEWLSGTATVWSDGRTLDLDERGWVRSLAPGQVARKLMLREIGDKYPAGRYSVRYKGKGTLKFGFAAKVVTSRPGEMVLEVTPGSGGILLVLETTDPGDPVRDIELVMPGGVCEGERFIPVRFEAECEGRAFLSFAEHHETLVFNPQFIARLRGYSVLRFVDWMRTNGSRLSGWSERARPQDATWTTDRGAPVEIMVALSNVVGAHPWFTLPHEADDGYVESFASVVAEGLRPDLGVYVEHSNEVWNSQFSQHRSVARKAAGLRPPLDGVQYHALRTRHLGEAFRRAVGLERIVVVLGAQAGNRSTATRALEILESRFGAGGIGLDAIAIAPYFGATPTPDQAPRYVAMGLDDLFGHARELVRETEAAVQRYSRVAAKHGLRLISYEGGQHMVGIRGAENAERLNVLFDAFNRDLRIRDVYLEYLEAWRRAGGGLFVHYNDVGRYTKWGRWGALEYIGQPRQSAPKFDALQTFIERSARNQPRRSPWARTSPSSDAGRPVGSVRAK